MGNVLADWLRWPDSVGLVLREEREGRVSGSVVLKALDVDLPSRMWEHPAVASSYLELDHEANWAAQRAALPRVPLTSLSPEQILTIVIPLETAARVAFAPDDVPDHVSGPDSVQRPDSVQLFTSLGGVQGRLRLVSRRGRWSGATFDTSLHCAVGRCDSNEDCGCVTCCGSCACVLTVETGFEGTTCQCDHT